MYLDIHTMSGCGCSLNFKTNNLSEYAEQPLGTVTNFRDNNFAVEFWIRPESPTGPAAWIMGIKSTTSTYLDNSWFCYLNEISPTTYAINFGIDSYVSIRSDEHPTYGVWTHIVINRISSNPRLFQIFINGKIVTTTITLGANYSGLLYATYLAEPQVIRYGYVGLALPIGHFCGDMAQCRLYSRPLKQPEVQFNARYGFFKPFDAYDIVLWAPFNNIDGVVTTSVHSELACGISLTGFGARTIQGGGAWRDDCPFPLSLTSGPCGERNACDLQQAEIDELLIAPCDFLALPGPFRDQDVAITDASILFCIGCEYIDPVGFINGRFTTDPYYINDTIEYKYNTFGFKIDAITTDGVFEMKIICDGTIIKTIGPVYRNAYATDEFYKDAILTQIELQAAPEFTLFGYQEEGVLYVKLEAASTQEYYDCLCASFIFARNFELEAEFDTALPTNKRPSTSGCVITYSPSSYTLLDNAGQCATKTQDLSCVKTERLLYLDAPCNYVIDQADIDCAPGSISNTPRICFGIDEQNRNFFSQDVDTSFKCDTILLRYRNENEVWKIARIEGVIKEVQYEKKQDISISSKGVTRKLASVIKEKYQLETNFQKKRFHDELLRAVEADYIEIEVYGEWIRMTNEGDYSVEWEDVGVPYRGKANITLTKYENKYLNNFC